MNFQGFLRPKLKTFLIIDDIYGRQEIRNFPSGWAGGERLAMQRNVIIIESEINKQDAILIHVPILRVLSPLLLYHRLMAIS